jgi:hypothetical protein
MAEYYTWIDDMTEEEWERLENMTLEEVLEEAKTRRTK